GRVDAVGDDAVAAGRADATDGAADAVRGDAGLRRAGVARPGPQARAGRADAPGPERRVARRPRRRRGTRRAVGPGRVAAPPGAVAVRPAAVGAAPRGRRRRAGMNRAARHVGAWMALTAFVAGCASTSKPAPP